MPPARAIASTLSDKKPVQFRVQCFYVWDAEERAAVVTPPTPPADLIEILPSTIRDFSGSLTVMRPGTMVAGTVLMSTGTNREGDVRRKIESALVRRREAFALSHLAWTANGYTVKFGQGIVILVRTAVDDGVIEDAVRLDKLLDGVRSDFRVFDP